MPSVPLFRRTTVTGRSSARDVAISCMTIWKPPSPVIAMTFMPSALILSTCFSG